MKSPFSIVLLIVLMVSLASGSALAHDGEPHGEGSWNHWNYAPSLFVGFLAIASLYIIGVGKLWGKSAWGMGVSRRQITFFFAGLLVLAAALISPLDALGAAALTWHMVQHLLVILVAAPLIILGNPMLALLWAFRSPALRQGGRWWNRQTGLRRALKIFSDPLLVMTIYAATVWFWHVPALYETALRLEWAHDLEHLSFLSAALLFWWMILTRLGSVHDRGYGLAVLILFTTMLQGGLLGALLTFSQELWYPSYQESGLLVSMTALEDQSLAGLLMWIPPSLVYLGFALSFLAKLLNSEDEQGARRLETLEES